MKFREVRRTIAALGLIVALGFGAVAWHAGAVGQESKPEINEKSVRHAQELSQAFRKAAEVAMPTVVTVRSKSKGVTVKKGRATPKRGEPGENPFKGTPFEDFFNGDDFGGMTPPGNQRREGMGSGVIIDKSGIVLTNNHVVEGADEVIVHLADGREFKAEDIRTDDQTDMAVLRIKGAGTLPAAKLGDSDKLEIGDWVIAIGNPFELEQTVSAGIISGKGRELGSIRRAKFLQTDAAINPGNSGGPLVNLDGEVIGINTAIATNNGSFQGIGFAVPSNTARWVMDQLIKRGNVERAYLGVAIGEVNKDLAEKFGVKRGEGVLVSEVFPNTPASEAGFKEGDIITDFEGRKVHNPRELQELVERVPLDTKHPVGVLRDGKHETLQVVAKSLPKQFGSLSRSSSKPEKDAEEKPTFESNKLGLEVGELAADDAESLGYKGFNGVLVTNVDEDGIAAEQGLRKGMLIMKVGKKAVKSVNEFKAAVKEESLKDGILLLIRSRGGNRFVVLQQGQ